MSVARRLLHISSSAIVTPDLFEALAVISGISKQIELSGGNRHDSGLLSRLLAFQAETGTEFLIHNYFPPPERHFVLNFADTGEETRGFIAQTMEYVRPLKVPYFSVHAGFRGDFTADRDGMLHPRSERTFSLEGIAENAAWFAAQWPDVPLALENIYPNNGNTACAFMITPEQIVEALERMPGIKLLLDLGHLKVSSRLIGFNFAEAVDMFFDRYGNRIVELHLSENHGQVDDHLPVTSDSVQYLIVRQRAAFLRRKAIRVTIEARAASIDELRKSHRLLWDALSDQQKEF